MHRKTRQSGERQPEILRSSAQPRSFDDDSLGLVGGYSITGVRMLHTIMSGLEQEA